MGAGVLPEQGRVTAVARYDRWSFWGIVLLLAIITLPIERFVGPASLRLVDANIVLLMVYMVMNIWRDRRRPVLPLLLPIWLIVVSSLVATLLGFAFATNLVAIVQEIYLWLFLVTLVNLLLRLSVNQRDKLLQVWAVVAMVIALTTVMGMLHIGPSMFYEIPMRDRYQFQGFDRGVGTYVNPNAAAAYLSTSFFVVLSTTWAWGLRLPMAVWIFVGMMGTGSNGAMGTTLVALAGLVVVYSLLRQPRRAVAWGWGLLGGTAVALLGVRLFPWSAVGGLPIDTLLSTTVRRAGRAFALRLELWQVGWREFEKRPWGIGPNSASEIHASLHSDYLAFLFERGILGFLGWLLLLLEPIWVAWRTVRRSHHDAVHQWQLLALAAGFLANILNAFVHELSHTRPLWLLMSFIFALSLAGYAPEPVLKQQTSRFVRWLQLQKGLLTP